MENHFLLVSWLHICMQLSANKGFSGHVMVMWWSCDGHVVVRRVIILHV